MDLKPIETVYNGLRFRSRLEARWAVLLDAIGVKYEYEIEGYDMDGLWYLPDFWLPDLVCWLEVKGTPVERGGEAWMKAVALANAAENAVYVFGGQIGATPDDVVGLEFMPFVPYEQHDPPMVIVEPERVRWFRCPLCLAYQMGKGIPGLPCGCVWHQSPRHDEGLVSAVLSARQARFERGRR